MLRREKEILFEHNNLGETPFYVAVACGKKEVFTFLEKLNSDCMMRRNDGCTILHAVVIGERYSNPWSKEIYDAKQKHTVTLKLAGKLIRREGWSHYVHTEDTDIEHSQFGTSSQKKNRVPDPLIQATRLGIIEVALEILRVYPESAYTFDENGRNILQLVVEKKHLFLYDYLMSAVIHKDRMLSEIDFEGNSTIDLAASLGSPPSTPSGVLLQMMWDVLWFKRVKYDSYPYLWELQNSSERQHYKYLRRIMKLYAKMLKKLPKNWPVISGNPAYLKNKHWEFFWLVIYLAGGLLSSLITMGTLLGIIFLRFDTEDFYAALPWKYVFTTIAMFYSAGFTILACCQAYIIETVVVNTFIFLVVLLCAYVLMALVFMDTSYLIFDYMCYVICHSFSYRGQETETHSSYLCQ
ncbi:hypothetical protein ACH5RR_020889 [Cinchona calisaya]|uniref:PGG domain-containing protein n=1 Tax=Cinchona calisaya TaxID=153742 RepID=A0ABD2ZFR1_9GENT